MMDDPAQLLTEIAAFVRPKLGDCYTYEGRYVFYADPITGRKVTFALAATDGDAWLIADRLNHFDLNLRERNFYQQLYLRVIEANFI